MYVCMYLCVDTHICTHIHTSIYAYIHHAHTTYIQPDRTIVHTYRHIYIHTQIHTNIHSYFITLVFTVKLYCHEKWKIKRNEETFLTSSSKSGGLSTSSSFCLSFLSSGASWHLSSLAPSSDLLCSPSPFPNSSFYDGKQNI